MTSVRTIPVSEVSFHPHSYADPDGRLFSWKHELYRAISLEKTPFFSQLFDSGVIGELVRQGVLIGSEPCSELQLTGFGMVVRHQRVSFVAYPHEWCAAMLKDAAIAYLDLVTELATRGLMLKDTHPWNILFEQGKPLYVDLTSITRLPPGAAYINDLKFTRYYIHPLQLMACGHGRLARNLLPSYEGIRDDDVTALIPTRPANRRSRARVGLVSAARAVVPRHYRPAVLTTVRAVRSRTDYFRGASAETRVVERLRDAVASLPDTPRRPAHDQAEVPSANDRSEPTTAIADVLSRLVRDLRPASMLVVGGDIASCALVSAELGVQTVTMAADEAQITRLYYEVREKRLPIVPLVMDFADPTPARGISSHLSIAAVDRLKCDLVVACNCLTSQVRNRHLRLDHVIEGLALFAARWLLIEYDLPPGETVTASPDGAAKYSFTAFMDALHRRFQTVSEVPVGTRRLLLCTRYERAE